jgi:hypothetical protein
VSLSFPDPFSPSPLAAPWLDHPGSSPQELLAALQRQDDPAIASLSARWAHRHGVESLQRLIQHLEVDSGTAAADTGPATISVETPAQRPARRFQPIRRLKSLVRDCIDEVASTFQEEADDPAVESQEAAPQPLSLARPPIHPDLGDLRSWLPDHRDDQHPRAS